jgi:protein translocase SecG subunit
MGWYIVILLIALTLIVLIYMQSGWARNVSSSIIGNQNLELFENTKTRGSERVLMILTSVFIFLLILVTIIIRITGV